MAKIIQTLVECDWCKKKWREDDEECPEERHWSWNGTAYVVEACEGCREEIRDYLKRIFEASTQVKRRGPGRPPNLLPPHKRRKLPRGAFDKYKNAEGVYECPFEGCEETYEYPQHLGNHHSRTHGVLLS